MDNGASDEKGADGNGVNRRRIKYSARNARTHIIIICYCNYCHYGCYYCNYYEKEVQRVFLSIALFLSLFATNIICVILIGGTLAFLMPSTNYVHYC